MIQVRALLWTCNLQGRKEHGIMDTIVAKFGGTSLADEEQFRKVAAIVAKTEQENLLWHRRRAKDSKVISRLLTFSTDVMTWHAEVNPLKRL